jgi:hypothetical protein
MSESGVVEGAGSDERYASAVGSYLQEIPHVLAAGGKALFHHSNNDRHPGRRYSENGPLTQFYVR